MSADLSHVASPRRGRPKRGAEARPAFVADHPALDFLNSVDLPGGGGGDFLESGEGLLLWAMEGGAIDPSSAATLRSSGGRAAFDKAARDAVALREWFRVLVRRFAAAGRAEIDMEESARLNALLAKDSLRRAFVPGAERPALRAVRRWARPADLLSPVAADIADFVCEADMGLVRMCENPACGFWFYDRTRSHRRRWCAMAACGNRAKVAAHRRRKKAENGVDAEKPKTRRKRGPISL